jgi:hypothetical protein
MKRPRAERRARERAQQHVVRDLERLARLAPGGAPERPIVVDSPAVVDIRATASPCPLCGGALRLTEHGAESIDGVRLRLAHVACTQCGSRRTIYFRLDPPALH